MNLLIRTLLLGLLSALANAANQLCLENGTVITRVPTIKTRQVIKKPTGLFRVFKKTKVYIEQYQDFEDFVETTFEGCCEGYNMTKTKECIPICANGCPSHALCIKPNKCECKTDYILEVSSLDGSHYCRPICDGGCPENSQCLDPQVCECDMGYYKVDFSCQPKCTGGCQFGGVCIGPEQCECQEGYAPEYGSCVPTCTAGDGCQNGVCVDNEQCICNVGYQLDAETQLCELCTYGENCDYEEMAATRLYENFDKTTFPENSDKNEKIYLTSPNDYTTEIGATRPYSQIKKKCPPNFIWFENICHPQIFSSNENDCRFKSCPQYAHCQANGTCACNEGYEWFTERSDPKEDLVTTQTPISTSTTTPEANVMSICLTLAEISERMQIHQLTEIDAYSDIDWMQISFYALGVLCILTVLCYFVIRILRRTKGKMDVEAKNDLQCSYDNKNYSDTPYVL